MKKLTQEEKILLAILLGNLLLQFVVWSFAEFDMNGKYFNREEGRMDERYSVTSFLIIGIVPLASFAIYYYVLKNKD